jgi:methylated-DNA-[protein]-cysteine S-methyltransferase
LFSYVLLHSRFGGLGIVWRPVAGASKVWRVFLPRADASAAELIQAAYPDAAPHSTHSIAWLADQMRCFLEGQAVQFDIEMVALDRCSDFQRRVLLAEHDIPRGWVSTYGRIARHLGLIGGARAVGGSLARNPFPIIIPCHRAIRSDGQLGGFQGGLAMKRGLLALEGVEISADGRVLTDRYAY